MAPHLGEVATESAPLTSKVTPLQASTEKNSADPGPANKHSSGPKKRWKMASLIAGVKRLAIGAKGAVPSEELFRRVDPAVDGDECLQDCDTCAVHLPRGFKIDEADELYGMVKGWQTHILVATGKTDWVRDVTDEKGSVMQAVGKAEAPSNGVSYFWSREVVFVEMTGRLTKETRNLCCRQRISRRRTTRRTIPSRRQCCCCPLSPL